MRFCRMFLVSLDRSEVPTHTERVRLLLKFRFRVKFSHHGVAIVYSVSRAGLLDFPQVLESYYRAHENAALAENF
jgi:hypothetical protein